MKLINIYFIRQMTTKILLILFSILISAHMMEYAYPCDVEGCQQCSYYNFCGVCKPNYILSINKETTEPFCEKVECEVDNCDSCLQTNVCNQCMNNYYITKLGTCKQGSRDIQCPSYCSYCDDDGKCELCSYGYILQESGYCFPRVILSAWCQVGFYQDMCQLCKEDYLVGVAYFCVQAPSFSCDSVTQNCLQCSAQDHCSECMKGSYLNNGTCEALECNVTYCEHCQSETTCHHCMDNYYLKDNECMRKIYSCNMMNCKSCALYPEVCTQCMPGYEIYYLDSSNPSIGAKCVQITEGDNSLVKYCEKFGQLIVGSDTGLNIGCLVCMENYINVGGYCMANLTQQEYLCDIDNCEYCVQNNYCGKCADGYYVQLFTGGYCWKNYSPLPYCDLTTIFLATCQICDDGFVNNQGNCVKFKEGTCDIEGCNFCLSDDVCMMCRDGFEFGKNSTDSTNSTCQPICSVQNCFTCQDSTNCMYCTYGYVLTDTGSCILATDAEANCTSDYGQFCTECNAKNCTACTDNYVLDEEYNYCCEPPTQNYMGCTQYESVCTSTCTKCKSGYFLIANQCFKLPCSIENCNYCFRNDVCIVCDQGYTLNEDDKTCKQFTAESACPNNCIACDGDGACTQCVNGYKINEGSCVCDFQNCLDCQGKAFCKQCAFPTIATIFSFPGCSPEIVSFSECNVDNCENCKAPSSCSECSAGYTLTAEGTCAKNTCTEDSNCLLCDISNDICFLCGKGTIQNELFGQKCVALADDYSCNVEGCGVCQTSNTCDTCLQFYQLTEEKKCKEYSCVENCLLCFEADTCFICDINYYLSTDNVCVPTTTSSRLCDSIQNCLICEDYTSSITNQTSLVCDTCFPGFNPNDDKNACEPQQCTIPNCQVCFPTSSMMYSRLCLICEQGYYLNSYIQCVSYTPAIETVSCDVYNCLHCDKANECAFCLLGWNATGVLCETNLYCDVNDCDTCTTPSNCTACNSNYELVLGGCTPQCNITNCEECANLQSCGSCKDTYILSDNNTKCVCPDDSFEEVDGKCQCKEGKLEFNGTCIDCTIEYCDFCSQANVCSQCLTTFNLKNNTCSCNDDTYVIQSNKCVCQTDFKEHDNTCIECKVDYCSECDTVNNCIQCDDTFEFGTNNTCQCPADTTFFENKCYLCDVDYCTTCSGNNFCNTCENTFSVNNGTCQCPSLTTLFNDTCIACNISNCEVCQEANVCESCMDQYTKLNNVCLSCKIDSCISCTSADNCGECSGDLQVNSQGNKCVECTNSNCDICSDTNTCAACSEGFQFNLAGTQCLNCSNVAGCDFCSSDNVCQKCLSGFNLASGECSVCSYPCDTCNSDGSCATCQSPFSTNSNSDNQCFTCSVSNCKTCSSTNTSQCQTCSGSYQLDISTKTCSLICSTNLCLSCSDPSVCEVCVEGYTPVGSGCQKCSNAPKCKACQSTDTTICTSCNEGYFLEGGNCISCSSNNCKVCSNGADKCEEFKASTNQIAFTNSNGTVLPAVCNPGCKTCSTTNPNTCITCLTGYSLQSKNCIPCTFPCKTCKVGDQTSCLSCYSNAFLNDNACNTCNSSSNCLTCSSSNLTQCTSCPYGYSLATNNTCVQGCPTNCLSCTNSSFCKVCSDGYSANSDGECLPCLSNCRGCSGSQQAVCVSCGQGFFLNTDDTCEVCTQFCSSCTTSDTCTTCMAGYTLTNSFVCAKNCQVPCATCSTSDPTKCSSCVAGYTLDQTQSKCDAVTSCTDNICQVCPFSYVLNGNSCFECDSSCARCLTTNSSKCTSCYDGSYLKSNECLACPEGCDTCSSLSNCLTCSSGYTIESSPVSSVVNCIQCESPCAQCIGDAQTCTSCVSGFQLQGWKCMSTFNFGLTLVLAVDLINFYPSYLIFLQALSEAVSSTNINIVTMIILKQGSTDITSNITTTTQSNSAEATTEYNSLNTLLGTGTIGGLQVTSSNLEVIGGEVQDSSSGVNLALILGITIPLAIILIGAIIYFCCSRRNKLDYNEKEDNDMTVRQEFELTNDVTGRAI